MPFQYVFSIGDYLRDEDQIDISNTTWRFSEVNNQIGQINPPQYNTTVTEDLVNLNGILVAYIPPNYSFTWIIERATSTQPRQAIYEEETISSIVSQKIRVELDAGVLDSRETNRHQRRPHNKSSLEPSENTSHHVAPTSTAAFKGSKIHLEL